MDYNGTGYFGFIKNLQGDIVSIVPLDSESNVEINMEYDAWGKPIIKQGSSWAEGLLMAMLMAVTNVGYRGYFYDFETGLYYLRSRYYDPEIGRFINADDTDYLGYDDTPLSMNLFAYCCNNSVNGVDYSGKFCYYSKVKIGNKHYQYAYLKYQTYQIDYRGYYVTPKKKETYFVGNIIFKNYSLEVTYKWHMIIISTPKIISCYKKMSNSDKGLFATILYYVYYNLYKEYMYGRSPGGLHKEIRVHIIGYNSSNKKLKEQGKSIEMGITKKKEGYNKDAWIYQ